MPSRVANPVLRDIIEYSSTLRSGGAGATPTHQYSLSWVYDADANPNDDVVYYFLDFLSYLEVLRLGMLSATSRDLFAGRSQLWQMKVSCPKRRARCKEGCPPRSRILDASALRKIQKS